MIIKSQILFLFLFSFIKSIKGFQEYSGRKCFFLEEFKSKKLIEQYEIYLTTELNMMINSIHNKMKTLMMFLIDKYKVYNKLQRPLFVLIILKSLATLIIFK